MCVCYCYLLKKVTQKYGKVHANLYTYSIAKLSLLATCSSSLHSCDEVGGFQGEHREKTYYLLLLCISFVV